MSIVKKPGYNYTINGLRGLCILMVFVYHIENSGIVPHTFDGNMVHDAIRALMQTFLYGVEIFFMISGYVICQSLKRHASMRAFLIDRVLRIYPTWVPLHILSFIAGPFLALGIFAEPDYIHWFVSFWANLFFLSPVLPFDLVHPSAWSLSYEWTFYLLAGTTMYFIAKRFSQNPTIIITCCFAILFADIYPRALFFIPGILVALWEDKLRTPYSRFFVFPCLALLGFLLCWVQTGVDSATIETTMLEWAYDERIVFACLAFLAGIYAFAGLTLENGGGAILLQTKPFQFLGNISYGFYLWSPVCMMVAKIIAKKFIPFIGDWGAVALFAGLGLVASLVVSTLNWVYIETKLTRVLKNKLHMLHKAPS